MHEYAAQVLVDILRHAFRKLDDGVVRLDVDVADQVAVETGLVGDGADDLTGRDAMV